PVTVAPDLYVDFSALPDVAALNQVAAVVDGLWELTDDGVRTTELGYDRLIALGSQDWSSDYEVLAEFTLHYWRNWGAVGVAVGWQGHTGAQDPREDWPLEALGWVRKVVPQPELQIMAYSGGVLDRRAFELVEGNTYLLRTRTERGAGNARSASLRIWPAGADEPADWLLETAAPLHDGSVLLVAPHADATWHNVTVTPLCAPGSTPVGCSLWCPLWCPRPSGPSQVRSGSSKHAGRSRSGSRRSSARDERLRTKLWGRGGPQKPGARVLAGVSKSIREPFAAPCVER